MGTPISTVGVKIFFVTSGFLITKSWILGPFRQPVRTAAHIADHAGPYLLFVFNTNEEFLLALPLIFVCAVLSWLLVEQYALLWKPRRRSR